MTPTWAPPVTSSPPSPSQAWRGGRGTSAPSAWATSRGRGRSASTPARCTWTRRPTQTAWGPLRTSQNRLTKPDCRQLVETIMFTITITSTRWKPSKTNITIFTTTKPCQSTNRICYDMSMNHIMICKYWINPIKTNFSFSHWYLHICNQRRRGERSCWAVRVSHCSHLSYEAPPGDQMAGDGRRY